MIAHLNYIFIVKTGSYDVIYQLVPKIILQSLIFCSSGQKARKSSYNRRLIYFLSLSVCVYLCDFEYTINVFETARSNSTNCFTELALKAFKIGTC